MARDLVGKRGKIVNTDEATRIQRVLMRKKLVIFAVAIFVSLTGVTAIVLQRQVPIRTYADSEWFQVEEETLKRVELDPVLQRMALRARIDNFLAPADKGRRLIYFDRAWLLPPHDVYLMFGIAGRADDVIIYRGNMEDGRLRWKAKNSRGP